MSNRDEKFSELLAQARKVLSDKNYNKECFPLQDLIRTIVDAEILVSRKVTIYKWFGLVLLMSIPLVSALLSVLVTQNSDAVPKSKMIFACLSIYAPYLSFLLTLMTIFNSIFKPGERFQSSCFIAIKIKNFRSNLIADLEKLSPVQDTTLIDLVQKHQVAFEAYQEKLIGLFLPETIQKT